MSHRLIDRLDSVRHRFFVDRTSEIALAQEAFLSEDRPFNVLYVYGPGGIGKTALLHELEHRCRQLGVATRWLDTRAAEPGNGAFTRALRTAAGLAPEGPLSEALDTPDGRLAVFIDGRDIPLSLEDWLRDELLQEAPAGLLIVIASRQSPATAWHAEDDWRSVMQVLPLNPLADSDAEEYLTRRGVPPSEHEGVLAFTHGHPLALSLVADLYDQRPGYRFAPESAQDIVHVLLQHLLQQVPSPAHRAALEACAIVRSLNEALLSAVLELPAVDELFGWLRTLSFVEPVPGGLSPHDLARELLVADLRWRNPDWYAELHRRARGYYFDRLRHATGPAQHSLLMDYLFLHRYSPVVRPFFDWENTPLRAGDARPGEERTFIDMLAAHEGADAARMAEFWLRHRDHHVVVIRDPSEAVVAFCIAVTVGDPLPAGASDDPMVTAAWRSLNAHAPLRRGETAMIVRFWLAREASQSVSPAHLLLFASMIRLHLGHAQPSVTFFPCAEASFWEPALEYAGFHHLPDADFVLGGRHYGVYAHDWRVVPPLAWLAILDERQISGDPHVLPPHPPVPIRVLTEQEFTEGVQQAFRDFLHPARLHDNPLVQSRLVSQRAGLQSGATERAAALCRLIEETVAQLGEHPRLQRWQRVLETAYLHPTGSQEEAAERLGLPFSTYRRHLKAGVAWVAEELWRLELGGVMLGALGGITLNTL